MRAKSFCKSDVATTDGKRPLELELVGMFGEKIADDRFEFRITARSPIGNGYASAIVLSIDDAESERIINAVSEYLIERRKRIAADRNRRSRRSREGKKP